MASTLKLLRNGAVGFIVWLGLLVNSSIKLSESEIVAPHAGEIDVIVLLDVRRKRLKLHTISQSIAGRIKGMIHIENLVVGRKAGTSPRRKSERIEEEIQKSANLNLRGGRKASPPADTDATTVPVWPKHRSSASLSPKAREDCHAAEQNNGSKPDRK